MSSRLRTRLRAGTGLSTPSLSLEFQTATGALDPRITFSRTSQATLVDSTGKLTYAPNNLLVNSEDFENAAWTKTAATIAANATVAPNGTTTADKFVENSDASPALHVVARAGAVVTGLSYVLSIYAKAAERTQLAMQLGTTVSYYNLSSGTVISGAGVIQSVGDGWYRCSLYVASAANSTCAFYTAVSGSATYQGNGTSGIFIWGAQLEQVTYQTTPGTYNSTSPKNLLGYTQEFDNAAWTKSNAFVQTNLLTYSQDFSNAAWAVSDTTATSNVSTAPDGSATADRVTETATTAVHAISQTLASLAATNHVFSIYLKKGSGATAPDWVQLTFGGASTGYANFNLSTGVVGVTSSATASITSVGSGWYRCSIIITVASAGSASVQVVFTNNTDSATRRPSYAGATTSDVLVWGAQLVQGSTAGDYQRTDAAAAAVQYVAPDGSRTADKLVETTAASTVHQVSQIYSGAFASGVYTFNVYLAKNERDKAVVIVSDNATGDCRVVVDLTAGTVGSPTITGNWTTASATIQAASGGFFRVSITCTKSASGNANVVPVVGLYTTSASYTGDGTSGIYIWGAQLSNSASLDPYVYNPVAAPTSAAYYGPRFDYDPVTLANKGLLIEEQRTNLLTYSQEFDNAAWPKQNATVTANAIVAPDGTTTADKLAEDASNTSHRMYQTTASAIANGTTVTNSVFLKAAERTWGYVRLELNDNTSLLAWFNLATGTIGTVQAGLTATMTSFGNGWYRCTVTGSVGTGATPAKNYFLVGTATGDTIQTYTGTSGSGIYVWGAQLEAGSFATSYIPTIASQVTRTADVALMQGANFSNWYNQNEGTFTVNFDMAGGSAAFSSNRAALVAREGATSNHMIYNGSSQITGWTVIGGVDQAFLTTGALSADTFTDMAYAYKVNDFAASRNGGTVATDTSGSLPVPTALGIGSNAASSLFLSGHIKRLGYYPTRLANAQLQSLTAQSTIPSLSLDFTTQVFNVG